MSFVRELGRKVRDGAEATREDALRLYSEPLEEVCDEADAIRRERCGDAFDMCGIVNAKCGRCTENCRFCVQSRHNLTNITPYPMRAVAELVEAGERDAADGALRFSFVTSGRRLTSADIDVLCAATRELKAKTNLEICVSVGLLDRDEFARLRDAGVQRVHNNLETSPRYFPAICTTHTIDDKIRALKDARDVGMRLCSGGLFGIGETPGDRIDLALTLRELGVKSVPINIYDAFPGVPMSEAGLAPLTTDDARRIVAVFRFLLPDAFLRLAGGRRLLENLGRDCFLSGANATISGSYLTTAGANMASDAAAIRALGYEIKNLDNF